MREDRGENATESDLLHKVDVMTSATRTCVGVGLGGAWVLGCLVFSPVFAVGAMRSGRSVAVPTPKPSQTQASPSPPASPSPSPSPSSLAATDGVRSLGFLWIYHVHFFSMLYIYVGSPSAHTYFSSHPNFAELALKGHLAVDAFNVLSAYFLTRGLISELRTTRVVRVAQFFQRRFLRLLPTYYAAVSVVWVVGLFQPDLVPGMEHVVYTLALVQNYASEFQRMFLQHTWTVALEVQVQLVLVPLFALLYPRLGGNSPSLRRVFMALLLTAWLTVTFVILWHRFDLRVPAQIHSSDWAKEDMGEEISAFYRVVYLPTHMRLTSYLFGVLLALFVDLGPQRPFWSDFSPGKLALTFVLLAATLVPRISSFKGDTYYPSALTVAYLSLMRLLFGFGCALLLLWCLTGQGRHSVLFRPLLALLTWPPWKRVATLSYSLYLWHVPLLGAVFLVMRDYFPKAHESHWALSLALADVTALGLTFLVASLSYSLFEAPLLKK